MLRGAFELGVFNSTIPVRLANAILDAPLQWQIRSVRSEGLTRYRTAFVAEEQGSAVAHCCPSSRLHKCPVGSGMTEGSADF